MLRRRFGAVVFATALVVTVVGCSSSDDASTGTTTASSASSPTTVGTTTTTVAAAEPSSGCGTATGAATLEKQTVDVAGTPREYLISTAAASADDDPKPLVVDFHGLSEGDQIHAQMSQMGPLAEKEGFVAVFPNGTGKPLGWQTGKVKGNPDLAFVSTLLDTVGEQRCIDETRVYATGLSLGAFMTSFVACAMGDRFAAVAPVSGIQFPEPCAAKRPMPILTFHGTADPILFFNGGVGADTLNNALGTADTSGAATTTTTTAPADIDGKGYPANVRAWAEHNGCDPEPKDTDVSKEVLLRTYSCPADADVDFYVIRGGGHTWPGSQFSKAIASIVGYTTFDIDATQLIWKFFQRFQLPAA